jgi:hypothetical protein
VATLDSFFELTVGWSMGKSPRLEKHQPLLRAAISPRELVRSSRPIRAAIIR